jgi:hypothetical protein
MSLVTRVRNELSRPDSRASQVLSYANRAATAYAHKRSSDYLADERSNMRRKHAKKSHPKKRKPSSAGVKRESGIGGERAPASTRRKQLKTAGKKIVKVSKKFKAAVGQALLKSEMQGFHQATEYGYFNNPFSGQQNVLSILTNGYDNWSFSPERILDAASVLWNSKPVNQIAKGIGAGSNFPTSVVVNVRSCSTTYLFRNNSQRTVELEIYQLTPKIFGPLSSQLERPDAYFNQCVQDDIQNGLYVPGQSAYQPANTTVYAQNLYMKPGMTSNWSKAFSQTMNKVVLEPGQTYSTTLVGPKNCKYDFSKFFVNGTFQTLQKKMSQTVMVVVRNDLGQTNITGGGPGRFKSLNGPGNFILVERTDKYDLSMPEQAGFVYPAATTAGITQQLNNRKRRYSLATYTNGADATVAGSITRIDEEQPATTEAI